MRSQLAIAGFLAAALHALVLFGVHPGIPARPLPLAAESLEVELTATPDVPVEAAAETPPEPVMPPDREPESPAPEAEPDPPIPEPPPVEIPAPTPEPIAEPIPMQEPKTPAAKPIKPKPPTPKPRPAPAAAKAIAQPATGPANSAAGEAKKPGPTNGVRVRSNPKPAYPSGARQAREQGVVTVDVEVSATGLPNNVTLARSSGFPALDAAALAGVRRWRFEPARKAGVAVTGRVRVPIRFELSR